MNNESVITICGNIRQILKKIDIESNPNFVFINDPEFDQLLTYMIKMEMWLQLTLFGM